MPRGGKRQGAGRKVGSKVPQLPQVKPEIKAELRELARSHAPEALEQLITICKTSENHSARVAAANAILDRGYGKPGQHVEVDVNHYARMDEDQLRELIEEQFQTIQLLDHSVGNGSTEH